MNDAVGVLPGVAWELQGRTRSSGFYEYVVKMMASCGCVTTMELACQAGMSEEDNWRRAYIVGPQYGIHYRFCDLHGAEEVSA